MNAKQLAKLGSFATIGPDLDKFAIRALEERILKDVARGKPDPRIIVTLGSQDKFNPLVYVSSSAILFNRHKYSESRRIAEMGRMLAGSNSQATLPATIHILFQQFQSLRVNAFPIAQ